MTTLTKASITEHLNDVLGITKCEARDIVEHFIEEICQSLERGEEVKLSGFGNFNLHDKATRKGRNPKTGEEHTITARRVVSFTAGRRLKKRVQSDGSKKAQN